MRRFPSVLAFVVIFLGRAFPAFAPPEPVAIAKADVPHIVHLTTLVHASFTATARNLRDPDAVRTLRATTTLLQQYLALLEHEPELHELASRFNPWATRNVGFSRRRLEEVRQALSGRANEAVVADRELRARLVELADSITADSAMELIPVMPERLTLNHESARPFLRSLFLYALATHPRTLHVAASGEHFEEIPARVATLQTAVAYLDANLSAAERKVSLGTGDLSTRDPYFVRVGLALLAKPSFAAEVLALHRLVFTDGGRAVGEGGFSDFFTGRRADFDRHLGPLHQKWVDEAVACGPELDDQL